MLDHLSKTETRRVASEFLKARMGAAVSHQHPATVELLQYGDKRSNWLELTRGLGTSDIAELVTASFDVIAQQAALPRHRDLLKFVKATSYRPQQIATNAKLPKLAALAEHDEFPEQRYTTSDTTTAQIIKHGASLLVSKELLRNEPEQLAGLPNQMLQGAFETESDEIFTVLEANGNLTDGSPLFTTGNTGTGTTLADALELWRGHINDADPAHIVLPPAQELSFREAAQLAGLKMSWHVRSDLTKAYLLADPRVKPTLVLLALSEQPAIDTLTRLPIELNAGLMVRVEHSFTIVPVSRNAISMTIGT